MLRRRVQRIVLGILAASALVAAAALYVFDAEIEDVAVEELLREQLDALLGGEAQAQQSWGLPGGLRYYRPAGDAQLPEVLRPLAPDRSHEVELDGDPYDVYVREIAPGDRAYLAFPTPLIEERESGLWIATAMAGLLLLLAARLAADRALRHALRPYQQLLEQVRALDPEQPQGRLHIARADPELNQVVSALNGRLEQIERLLERERAFAAGASHELRGPLTVIAASAELLRDLPADAATRRTLARLDRASRDAREMLEALLALSRRRESPPREELRLEAFLPAAVEPYLAEQPSIGVDWALQPQRLLAPPGAVRVVFVNLFRNALQAAPQGPIRIRLAEGCVTVEDDGPGIPAALLEHLFEPGFCGREGGTGMGLYISKVLSERYGWTLSLENRPEGGARAVWCFGSTARSNGALTEQPLA